MRLSVPLALVMAACALTAQSQASGDEFFQAIRNNDLASMARLVKQEGIEHKDPLGHTPLILASAFGSSEAVEVLLTSGANPNAASSAGITALHASRGDAKKIRLLLSHGAAVNARTQLGRTPLMVAASSNGSEEAVRLLIERGADVKAADTGGLTPLLAAARSDDAAVAKLLIGNGADANAGGAIGPSATPLMAAAYNGNTELVRLLLARGATVDSVSRDFAEVVKNGRVQFGRNTALHMGVASGSIDVVKRLLDAGAPVDPLDVRGMTPLMWAVANDHADPRVIRMLLDKGANPLLKSNGGETAVDWARKFNSPAVLAEFKVQPLPLEPQTRQALASSAPDQIRQAVERSMPLLRTASSKMLTDGGCVACHAQPMTGMAMSIARTRGWRIDPPQSEVSEILTRIAADATGFLQIRDGGGFPDTQLYSITALAALNVPSTLNIDAVVYYIAAKQQKQGNWHGLGATRPPLQDGDIFRTAMGVRALTAYAAPARKTEFAKRVDLAGRWLSMQTPVTTTDRAMQLLGLKWADAHAGRRDALARELKALQRGDGGWAQTPHLSSDAYATGQVIYTLREIGVPAADPSIRRGVEFLLRTQREDGSWYVKSRAAKIQPYFESGYPHGDDQWISHPAAAWAVMGLSMMAPEAPAMTRAGK